jgi:hypothetical protein
MRTKKYFHSWRFTAALLVAALMFLHVNGQNNYIFYGMESVPQASFLNPAFNTHTKFVVGIPALSNVDVSYFNSAGAFNDFFSTEKGNDSLYLDLSKVISQNHPVDHINIALNHDLLFIGFKINESFLSFGIRQRAILSAALPSDLFKLAWNGNAPYVGQTLDLSTTLINENHFIDYHIGLAVPVVEGLRLGLRLHLLQGLSNIYTVNNRLQMTTLRQGENAYEVLASTRFVVNTSGIPDSTDFDPVNYFTNFKNIGFSLDIGATYQINQQFSVSFSLLDMGSNNFRTNTKSYQSEEDSIHFNGFKLDFTGDNDPFANIGDSLSNLLHVTDFSQNYRAKIPKQMLIGGEFLSHDLKNRASVLFSGRFYPDYVETALSIAYERFLSESFSVKVNYTYLKYAPLNLGLAFTLNAKPFQLYVYTNNIFGIGWDKQHLIQAGFGLNIRIPEMHHHIIKKPAEQNLKPELIEP